MILCEPQVCSSGLIAVNWPSAARGKARAVGLQSNPRKTRLSGRSRYFSDDPTNPKDPPQ